MPHAAHVPVFSSGSRRGRPSHVADGGGAPIPVRPQEPGRWPCAAHIPARAHRPEAVNRPPAAAYIRRAAASTPARGTKPPGSPNRPGPGTRRGHVAQHHAHRAGNADLPGHACVRRGGHQRAQACERAQGGGVANEGNEAGSHGVLLGGRPAFPAAVGCIAHPQRARPPIGWQSPCKEVRGIPAS